MDLPLAHLVLNIAGVLLVCGTLLHVLHRQMVAEGPALGPYRLLPAHYILGTLGVLCWAAEAALPTP